MTCPYCQQRPLTTRPRPGGWPAKDCGTAACRLARRRETNAASHQAQNVERKTDRLRRAALPQTLTCRACAEPFAWDGRSARRPHYCQDADCRRARTNDRAYRYFLRWRAKGCGTQDRPGSLARPLAPPLPANLPRVTNPTGPVEPTAHVERLLAQARQARLREERQAGQRRYTIESGWMQKPGAVDWMDADGQATGWRR